MDQKVRTDEDRVTIAAGDTALLRTLAAMEVKKPDIAFRTMYTFNTSLSDDIGAENVGAADGKNNADADSYS